MVSIFSYVSVKKLGGYTFQVCGFSFPYPTGRNLSRIYRELCILLILFTCFWCDEYVVFMFMVSLCLCLGQGSRHGDCRGVVAPGGRH